MKKKEVGMLVLILMLAIVILPTTVQAIRTGDLNTLGCIYLNDVCVDDWADVNVGSAYTGIAPIQVDTVGNVIGLSVGASDDWNGTFDGQEGTYYLNFTNLTSRNFSLLSLDNNASFDARYSKITDTNGALDLRALITDVNGADALRILTSDSNNTSRLLYSVIANPPTAFPYAPVGDENITAISSSKIIYDTNANTDERYVRLNPTSKQTIVGHQLDINKAPATGGTYLAFVENSTAADSNANISWYMRSGQDNAAKISVKRQGSGANYDTEYYGYSGGASSSPKLSFTVENATADVNFQNSICLEDSCIDSWADVNTSTGGGDGNVSGYGQATAIGIWLDGNTLDNDLDFVYNKTNNTVTQTSNATDLTYTFKGIGAGATVGGSPLSIQKIVGVGETNSTQGTTSWSDPNNVTSEDSMYANSSPAPMGGGDENTHYLRTYDTNFDIPSTATIDGIEVTVLRSDGTMAGTDALIQLMKDGGLVGDNNTQHASWPMMDENATFGGNKSLWGTTWTPGDVNKSGPNGFGFILQGQCPDFSMCSFQVDSVYIKIYYTSGGSNADVNWSQGVDRSEVGQFSFDRGNTLGADNVYTVDDNKAFDFDSSVTVNFNNKLNDSNILFSTDFNNAYVQKFPTAPQEILGHDLNLTDGNFHVNYAASIDGSQPARIVINNTRNSGSWTAGGDNACLQFGSDDGSGVGRGIRAAVCSQTSGTGGGSYNLAFKVDAGAPHGLVEVFRFDKDTRFQIADKNQTGQGRFNVFTSHVAQPVLYGETIADHTGDLVQIRDSGLSELFVVDRNGFVESKRVILDNGVVPAASVTDSVILYADDNAAGNSNLFVRNEQGDVTQLSPHGFQLYDPDPSYSYPWSFYACNDFLGKCVEADIYGAIQEIEALSGKTFLHEASFTAQDWTQRENEKRAEGDDERARIALYNASVPEKDRLPLPPRYTRKQPPKWLKDRGVVLNE